MSILGRDRAGVAELLDLEEVLVLRLAFRQRIGAAGVGLVPAVLFIAGPRDFAALFEFLAEELSVAQAQDLLVDADAVRAREHRVVAEFRLLADQMLGVDDDLALAAEISRHRALDEAFEADAVACAFRRPAQDEACALGRVRLRLAVVADRETHDHIVAARDAERGEIELVPIALVPADVRRIEILADERERLLLERDVLAGALRERDGQARRGDAVVVARLEREIPVALTIAQQRQRFLRLDHAHVGRAVGDCIETVQAIVDDRRRAFEHDAIQRRCGERAFAGPRVAVARELDPAAVVERERRTRRLRIEMQAPRDASAFGNVRVERRFALRRQARVRGCRDIEPDAIELRRARIRARRCRRGVRCPQHRTRRE